MTAIILNETYIMRQEDNNMKERAGFLLGWLVALLAWMIALSLAYTVYLKLKLLFH
jgi:hypothetical protein